MCNNITLGWSDSVARLEIKEEDRNFL